MQHPAPRKNIIRHFLSLTGEHDAAEQDEDDEDDELPVLVENAVLLLSNRGTTRCFSDVQISHDTVAVSREIKVIFSKKKSTVATCSRFHWMV